MKVIRIAIVLLIAGALSIAPAFSQAASGSISGTVRDASGAAVPGAEVKVTSVASGREWNTVTSDVGSFAVPSLIPGAYTVEVSLTGFKTFVAEGVKVNVGEEFSIVATLEIGDISETVTVTSGVDLVATSDTQISTTIQKRQIDDLPLNGRNPLALITLNAGTANNGLTGTSIAGVRISFVNISQDGVNIQDNFIRSNASTFTPNRLTQSQVGEFSLTTQNQGVSSGFGSSQVNFVTPSGTNQLHGDVYWVHRNDAAAATSFFNNLNGVEQPSLIRNQVGFSVSGPVVKDKLLFYANLDLFRERTQTGTRATILSPDARQGIYTYTTTGADGIPAGQTRQIDLLALRGLSLDPTIQQLLAEVPSTFNDFQVGDGVNTGGFFFNQGSNEDREQWGFRLDYNLNDQHSFEGIFRDTSVINERPDIDSSFRTTPLVFTDSGPRFFSTAWNWAVTPTFLNQVRFGANLSPVVFETDQQFPRGFKISTASFTTNETNFERQGRDTDTWNFADNASWQRGAHSFRFGFQGQSVRINSFAGFNVFQDVTLGTDATNGFGLSADEFPGGISSSSLNRADDILADLGGILDDTTLEFNVLSRDNPMFENAADDFNWIYDVYGFYFGDAWRVSPRLTLNLGLRWEYYDQLRERDNLITQTTLGPGGDAVAGVLDPNGGVDFVDKLINNENNNFAPTVGFAWDIFGDGKTAVRGSYGISYANDEVQRAPGNAINRFGIAATVTRDDLTGLLSDGVPTVNAPAFKLPLSFVDDITNPASPFFVTTNPAAFNVDPNLKVPYIQTWSFGIQREVGWDTAVEVRYVGTRAVDLVRSFDFNQVRVRESGFLTDFINAQNNAALAQAAGLGFNPAFNASIPGSVPLPVFDQLAFGGLLNNGTIRTFIQRGEPGELMAIYFTNGLCGNVLCGANPNVFVADVVTNQGFSKYHGGIIDVRRRFSDGLLFNANYTFSKSLTNASGVGQTNFEPILDLANPDYDVSRAVFDITHNFNANFVYELPIGSGHRVSSSNGFVNKVLSGWQINSIFNWRSGDPFGIMSNRGTLNRAGRSNGRNTASSNLDNSAIRDLIGVSNGPSGPIFIDPSLGGTTFTHPAPGQLGNLETLAFNGPNNFNWDFGIIKRTHVTEDVNVEFRAEFFNFTNHTNFGIGNSAQTSNTLELDHSTFGQITGTNTAARVTQFSLKINF
ncbi:MAG TPA: TonB-dependent receptor [Acidobacteriota bacterium]|nr:TonB-dependent receptor [Acidobacteriota bacterium]